MFVAGAAICVGLLGGVLTWPLQDKLTRWQIRRHDENLRRNGRTS